MTLRTILGRNEAVARLVAVMIPHCDAAGFPTMVGTVAVMGHEGLVAGVVFYNHNRAAGTIDVAAAAVPQATWLTRPVIQAVFDAAFQHFGCQMAVMRTSSETPLAARLQDFGFDVVAIPRLYGRNVDGFFCTLTIEQWAAHPLNRKTMRREAA